MSLALASSVLLITSLATLGQPLTVDGNGTVQIRAIDEAHLYFVGTERDSGREAVRAVNFPVGDWVNVQLTLTIDSHATPREYTPSTSRLLHRC